MTHDHGGVERREIHVLCEFRGSGQRYAPCTREARGFRVGRTMIRHRHAPTKRGREFNHRQGVGSAADQQQLARQHDGRHEHAHPWRIELDDARIRRRPAGLQLFIEPGCDRSRQARRT